jgi:hypothetical protein
MSLISLLVGFSAQKTIDVNGFAVISTKRASTRNIAPSGVIIGLHWTGKSQTGKTPQSGDPLEVCDFEFFGSFRE